MNTSETNTSETITDKIPIVYRDNNEKVHPA